MIGSTADRAAVFGALQDLWRLRTNFKQRLQNHRPKIEADFLTRTKLQKGLGGLEQRRAVLGGVLEMVAADLQAAEDASVQREELKTVLQCYVALEDALDLEAIVRILQLHEGTDDVTGCLTLVAEALPRLVMEALDVAEIWSSHRDRSSHYDNPGPPAQEIADALDSFR